MNATQKLHALGQSLCLDHITHALLTSGTLARYIRELAVTGLASNPKIFDHAIRRRSLAGMSNEAPDTINTMPEKTSTIKRLPPTCSGKAPLHSPSPGMR